jgi:hypothetical protein
VYYQIWRVRDAHNAVRFRPTHQPAGLSPLAQRPPQGARKLH